MEFIAEFRSFTVYFAKLLWQISRHSLGFLALYSLWHLWFFTFTIQILCIYCFINTQYISKKAWKMPQLNAVITGGRAGCFSLSGIRNVKAKVMSHWQTRGKGAVVWLFLSTYTLPVFYCSFGKKNIRNRSITSNLFSLTYHMISLHNHMFDLYPLSLCKTHSQKQQEVFCNQNEAKKPVEYCMWK